MADTAAKRVDYREEMVGRVPGSIDHGVERTPSQRADVAIPIAAQLLHLGEELRVVPAAVEQRDAMPSRERRVDDVAAENIDFLIMCYQALGDQRLLDPIVRGMNAFLVTQQGPPQSGWALQYTPDLKPAGARTYEPNALVTHTTATNIELLIRFYRLTGDAKFLARIPDALEWLWGGGTDAGIGNR